MKKFRVVVLITVIIFISIGLYARDIYVSPTGSGSSFTLASPGSAQAGIAAAQPGDTVMFLNGTYVDSSSTWQHSFNPSRSGTADNPITYKAVNQLGAIVRKNTNGVTAIGIQGRSHIIIDGFKSQGLLQIYSHSNYCVIKNCEVTRGSIQGTDTSLNWGIAVVDSSNCTVQNNYVHDMDNSGNHSHNTACIMVFGDSNYNVFEFNTVDGGDNIGCAYGTKGGGMDDNIWRYNFGKDCVVTGFLSMGTTAGGGEHYRNKVYNNVIINTPRFFQSYKGGHDWQLFNNSAYNVEKFVDFGYFTDSNIPSDHTIYNNLAQSVTDTVYYRDASSPSWPSNFFTYCDFNQMYDVNNWGRKSGSTYSSLSSWRTVTSSVPCDIHSITSIPNFVNPGGTAVTDYKRSSYPTNGRGGSYGSVIGAFITGNETIGYTSDGPPLDTNAPAAPTGVTTTVIQ